jgi:hypothetical protein
MVAQLVLGVALRAFAALGRVDNTGDSPAGDPLQDAGLRELREVCDHGNSSSDAIDIARAVLLCEGENPPAVVK